MFSMLNLSAEDPRSLRAESQVNNSCVNEAIFIVFAIIFYAGSLTSCYAGALLGVNIKAAAFAAFVTLAGGIGFTIGAAVENDSC